jgi:hypothetical protein
VNANLVRITPQEALLEGGTLSTRADGVNGIVFEDVLASSAQAETIVPWSKAQIETMASPEARIECAAKMATLERKSISARLQVSFVPGASYDY